MIIFGNVLIKLVVILGLSTAIALPNLALAQTCKATDPTGTPLNVRAEPNGKVIGQIKNGTMISVSAYEYDNKNKPWALAFNVKTDRYIGWVYREFISCY